MRYCFPAECGSLTPAARHLVAASAGIVLTAAVAANVSPPQSLESSPCGGSPPSTLPSGPRTVGIGTLSNRDIYHYCQRKLSRFDYDVRCSTLPSGKPELVIWLALWAVGTVLAAEDRWLAEHAWLDPKCPYESTGGPRR
jgi:hypothetical protein